MVRRGALAIVVACSMFAVAHKTGKKAAQKTTGASRSVVDLSVRPSYGGRYLLRKSLSFRFQLPSFLGVGMKHRDKDGESGRRGIAGILSVPRGWKHLKTQPQSARCCTQDFAKFICLGSCEFFWRMLAVWQNELNVNDGHTTTKR